MTNLIDQQNQSLIDTVSVELARENLDYLRSYLDVITRSMAANTLRGFATDVREFFQFCRERGHTPIPAAIATVQGFIHYRAGQDKSPQTIARAISNMSKIHDAAGVANEFRSEITKAELKALRRQNRRPTSQAPGIRYSHLEAWDQPHEGSTDLACLRDRALLWLGYDGMLRSDEMARAEISWLRDLDDDAVLEIPFHKTSQDKEDFAYLSGKTITILKKWFEAAGITQGTIIRSFALDGKVQDSIHPNSISKIITKRAVEMGILGASSHSLRIGATQDLIERNESNARIQLAGRWKSERMVAVYGRVYNLRTGAMATMAVEQGRTRRKPSPHGGSDK